MRTLKLIGAVAAMLVLAAIATLYGLLRGSLPQLDGELHAPGLTAPVHIARDALGVPTIEASGRADLAYGTGFAHGQDRFSQMDLARRLAAGELAELFGAVAIEQDRATRLFRFRSVAREVLAAATPAQRAVLEAYTRGVNAGIASLHVRPWEYLLLGAAPVPWRSEDSVLVEHAMWWDLQVNGLRREKLRQEINARLGGPQCAGGWKCVLSFLYPAGTSWDAPAAEGPVAAGAAPVPDAGVLDVRDAAAAPPLAAAVRTPAVGSNSWAVAGTLTASGAALIANDMHLGQRVPATWYHLRMRLPAHGNDAGLDLTGVTLPGAPLLVAGSNGHIAWGFTNSYGNWLVVTRAACGGRTSSGSASRWAPMRCRSSPSSRSS